MKRVFSIVFFILTGLFPASAQFFNLGDEPGSLEWNEITTTNYRIVFPRGTDSLAREFAKSLEINRPGVGASIGFLPNEAYRRQMPVILHPNLCTSNGVVTWAPRRMELFTTPSVSPLSSVCNIEELAIHESRHVAQMQLGAAKPYRWLKYVGGELWAGAMSALYPGPALLEGDAVVAETELSPSGRGRSASFLKYYDYSFSKGDWRDFYQWRYGSQKKYTPDHYRAGYFTLSGIRTYYDCPNLSRNYFRGIGEGWPLPLFHLQKTVKEASGKNFRETFRDISKKQEAAWEEEAQLRAPFSKTRRVTGEYRLYVSFKETASDGKRVWSILSGLDRTPELVEVFPDWKVKRLCGMSASSSGLCWSENHKRLFWSETITDTRWSLKSTSVIRYRTEDGKRGFLTRGTRYFHPYPSGKNILATEYAVDGVSAIVELDGMTGELLRRIQAPRELQVLECISLNGRIYCSCLGEKGQGIYDSSFNAVLEPEFVSIKNLQTNDGKICFCSDRNGSDEFYSLCVENGETVMLSSTRYGGWDYRFVGDSLYFSGTSALYSIAKTDLRKDATNFHDVFRSPVAEKLSSQVSSMPKAQADTSILKTKPYYKLPHLFKFHSWVPAYVNFNALESMTMSDLQSAAGLGATAFFQNDLNSFSGFIAYSAWNKKSGWRSSGHASFKYTGLYPVIEAKFDIGNSDSRQYFYRSAKKDTLFYSTTQTPLTELSLKAYVPINLSSGGWSRGIVPQLQYSYSNDCYYNEKGKRIGFHTLSAAVRAYTMQSIPSSCIYPRWGIGAEIGGSYMPKLDDLSNPVAYARIYGYLPGIIRTHGIRLDALGYNTRQGYVNLTYAFPFAAVDWSFLCPVIYIRNFEFYAKARLSNYKAAPTQYGGELVAHLGNLIWIPYHTRIGVSVNYCPSLAKKVSAGLVFSISM